MTLKNLLDTRSVREGETLQAIIVAEATDGTYDYDVRLITTSEVVRASRATSGEKYEVGEVVLVLDLGATGKTRGGGYVIVGRPPFAMRHQDAPRYESGPETYPMISKVEYGYSYNGETMDPCLDTAFGVYVYGENFDLPTIPDGLVLASATWVVPGKELSMLLYATTPGLYSLEWPYYIAKDLIRAKKCVSYASLKDFTVMNYLYSSPNGQGWEVSAGDWTTIKASLEPGDLLIQVGYVPTIVNDTNPISAVSFTPNGSSWVAHCDETYTFSAPDNEHAGRVVAYSKIINNIAAEPAPGIHTNIAVWGFLGQYRLYRIRGLTSVTFEKFEIYDTSLPPVAETSHTWDIIKRVMDSGLQPNDLAYFLVQVCGGPVAQTTNNIMYATNHTSVGFTSLHGPHGNLHRNHREWLLTLPAPGVMNSISWDEKRYNANTASPGGTGDGYFRLGLGFKLRR